MENVSILSRSSSATELRSTLELQALDNRGAANEQSGKMQVNRRRSNVSDLSRIITTLRGDINIDSTKYAAHKTRLVEEVLLAQLDQVSRSLTHISGASTPTEESCEEDGESDSDHPIDGRFAFWQAFLGMLLSLLTWGANAAFGVFLNFYLNNEIFGDSSIYHFAFMGGLVVCLANFLCPFCVLLVKIFGTTPVLLAGIVIQTTGYLLAAQCTHFWQLFLCQGFMVGLSFACIFIPGSLVIPTWFNKYLALAMGIAVAGAGLGGLMFSFILNAIILATGDQKWALRVTGLINLVIALFATVFMRVRNRKPINFKENLSGEFLRCALKVVFDIKVFNSYPLVIAALWFGVVLMGYVIVLFSFLPYATSEGLSAKQAASSLAVLNVLQVVGRPSIGCIGDFLGRQNISFIICCYLSVLLLVFWLQAKNYASIMVLAALIGAAAGVGSTMAQSMAHDILEFQGIADKLPAVWGGMNIVVSLFVLPAEVIALKLKQGDGPGSYRNAQIFTSCTFFAGALLLLVNREWLVRQTLISRRFAALEAVKTKQSSYLQSVDLIEDVEDSPKTTEHRIKGYDRLLARNPLFFLVRAFYPIRV